MKTDDIIKKYLEDDEKEFEMLWKWGQVWRLDGEIIDPREMLIIYKE